ncbi:MAG: hypothetical protein GY756_25730 [bacterium]|nr:hypothetical protein [bacterium]
MSNVNKSMKWKALRFEQEKENRATQLGVFVIMMVIALVLFVYNDYYFSAIIFIGTMMMYYLKKSEQSNIDIIIDDKGISVDDKILPYSEISKFWIVENKDETNYLLIRFKFALINPTKIYTINSDVNLEELRTFLKEFLKEKRIKERIYEKLINRI